MSSSSELQAHTLVLDAIEAILTDKGFLISSPQACAARTCAEKLHTWVKNSANNTEFQKFSKQLMKLLEPCLAAPGSKVKSSHRAKMWEKLFKFQISSEFKALWDNILSHSKAGSNVLCYQRITDIIVEKIIFSRFQVVGGQQYDEDALTYEERNAIRYAAGYIVRNLRKKLRRSAHKHKNELLQHLDDLVSFPADSSGSDQEQQEDSSCNWLNLLDHSGLIHVNEMVYQTIICMEVQLRPMLVKKCQEQSHGLNVQCIVEKLTKDEDVLFHWTLVSGSWDEEVASTLLHMVTELWVTIREFAHVSAWIEKYKQSTKKSIQKSQGVRKNLNV